ncbi:hypothetical protein ANN_19591 [Periplaneta americana]|uniref:HTH CENPB-type domain-containing protein n=1 Tax=Periplaneta americana TaxID=6978 RepID=A0ABQ8SAI6_PERAM|nr:hypothetical protein ANN_19591 [Periplaneta americana]
MSPGSSTESYPAFAHIGLRENPEKPQPEMPRTYKKKKPTASAADMESAVRAVIEKGQSIRSSAQEHGLKKSNLANYVKEAKRLGVDNVKYEPNFRKSQVFNNDMEKALEEYLLMASAMFYGLTPHSFRRLAYEFASKNDVQVPVSWETTRCAGPDWLTGFMKRHERLSIRTPEATSLARMTSFNRTTVGEFMDKLESVKGRYFFTPDKIFNLDEVCMSFLRPLIW